MSRIIRCSHRSRGPTYKLADDAEDDDDFDNILMIFYLGFDRAYFDDDFDNILMISYLGFDGVAIGRVDLMCKMMMILIIIF